MIKKLNNMQLQNVSGGTRGSYTKNPDNSVTVSFEIFFQGESDLYVITYPSWQIAKNYHPDLGSFSLKKPRTSARLDRSKSNRARRRLPF